MNFNVVFKCQHLKYEAVTGLGVSWSAHRRQGWCPLQSSDSQPRGCKCKTWGLQVGSCEGPPPGLQMAAFPPLSAQRGREGGRGAEQVISSPSSCKDTNPIRLRVHPYDLISS